MVQFAEPNSLIADQVEESDDLAEALETRRREARLDEALKESFPASDPAGSDRF